MPDKKIDMIHEFNVKIDDGEEDHYYGIELYPPLPEKDLKAAIKAIDCHDIRIGRNCIVGYWINGGCYSGGTYKATETYINI